MSDELTQQEVRQQFWLRCFLAGMNATEAQNLWNDKHPIARVTRKTLREDWSAIKEMIREESELDRDTWRNVTTQRLNLAIKALYPRVVKGDVKAIAEWRKLNMDLANLHGAMQPARIQAPASLMNQQFDALTDEQRWIEIDRILQRARQRAAGNLPEPYDDSIEVEGIDISDGDYAIDTEESFATFEASLEDGEPAADS